MIRLAVMTMAIAAGAALSTGGATAQPSHGLTMYGEPALPPDFQHLPHANPDAPKGGSIKFADIGGFDSMNPYIVKGRAPWAVRFHSIESLLGRSWDEPFTLYGLLAESVEIADDNSWVEFHLRPEARFSDGSAVTIDDVIFSMEMLGEKGLPNYRNSWKKVTSYKRISDRGIRFGLTSGERELPLILGLRPILQKAQWAGRDFAETTLEPLVGSGPYTVSSMEPGRYVELSLNPEYWGANLPFNRGLHNFQVIRYEFFRDEAAQFESFSAGESDIFRDGDPNRWASGYQFARATSGEITLSEVSHGRPTGMHGFVFNARRPLFEDIRVREALTLAFDFEWINKTLNANAFERIQSYFSNSPLAFDGPAMGAERAVLQPHADALPEGALDAGLVQPASDGSGRNRRNLRAATKLLNQAGWTVRNGVLTNTDGAPFSFEILLVSGANERVAGVFAESLKKLGVEVNIRLVDSAQYQARLNDYDYDMVIRRWALSLSPGNEQRFYWGGDGASTPGTRNYMGVDNPAVEAAIDAILAAEDEATFTGAVKALDRALTVGRYVIPFWHSPVSRIAHSSRLAFPERTPLYGDWIGFMPQVWWSKTGE